MFYKIVENSTDLFHADELDAFIEEFIKCWVSLWHFIDSMLNILIEIIKIVHVLSWIKYREVCCKMHQSHTLGQRKGKKTHSDMDLLHKS